MRSALFLPAAIALVAATGRARAQAPVQDPLEHGHGHAHAHPHGDDPHHHHPHVHPHPDAAAHHHPAALAPAPATAPGAAAPPQPTAPRVTALEPESGPPGTELRLVGSGFGPDARVHLGAAVLRPTRVADGEIVVVIPPDAGSQVPIVRQAGLPDAAAPRAFVVQAPPRIAAIKPPTAAPGARVELVGSGFAAGDQVLLGEAPVEVLELQADRIAVRVPAGAARAPFSVVRGTRVARSPKPFLPRPAAPAITGLTPAAVAPGGQVRVLGENFGATDRASLAGEPLRVVGRGPTFIEVATTPRSRSGPIRVFGPGGEAVSPAPLTLVRPPAATSFAPAAGPPSTRVVLRGRDFLPDDQVVLDGAVLAVVERGDDALTVIVPDGSRGGAFAVRRGPTETPVPGRFDVLYPPAIAGFDPPAAPAGADVTIEGTSFLADVRVLLAGAPLRITSRADTRLVVTLPAAALVDRFVVVTRAGQATAAKPIEVFRYPRVASFAPASGPAGTRVVLRGEHFSAHDRALFRPLPSGARDLALAVESTTARELAARIPEGAAPGAGVLIVESRGKAIAAPGRFQVVAPPPPLALVFSPMSGTPGTTVTLSIGRPFSPDDRVLLQGRPLAAKRVAGHAQAQVRIPDDAATGVFEVVRGDGARVRAERPFQVIPKVGGSPGAGIY